VNFEAIRLFERPFLAGVAVMGESGLYGTCRVAAGIVGTADLMLGKGVEAVLREHQKVARNFRGIRYMGGKAETIDFLSPKFIEALQVLERMGLTYDCGGPEEHPGLQLEPVLSGLLHAARACPKLTVVINHCGGAVGPYCFEENPGQVRTPAIYPHSSPNAPGPLTYPSVHEQSSCLRSRPFLRGCL